MNFLQSYGYEFLFSVFLALLISNVVLLVKIKYGDALITHLT